MNILCLSDSIINDPFNGGSLRIWNLLNKGNANVFYFKSQEKTARKNQKTLAWKSISTVECDRQNFSLTKSDIITTNFLKRNQQQLTKIENILQAHLSSYPDTSVIVYGHKMGLLASKLIPGKFIFDGCDSMSLYYHRRDRALNIGEWQKKINSKYLSALYKSIESHIARNAALYLVPAEADRQWIRKSCSQANVVAIGNGTEWIDLPPIENFPDKTTPTIAFHGGMTWEPNRSAALYLIREIFPKIRAVIPNAQLKIAGTPVFDDLSACNHLDGVEICGFVDDIRQWLTECDVYVMPMLQGSGVKNKLIEVMAAGLPMVTNNLGAEALSSEAKSSIAIADSTEAIANTIIDLLQNGEKRLYLGQKARTIAEKSFHWQALSKQLMAEIAQTNYCLAR